MVPASPTGKQDELLKEAVKRARQARRSGIGGQTSIIMRDMLDKALHRSSRKFKITIGVLVFALMGVTAYAGWTIHNLKQQKTQIDVEINQVETELQSAGDDPKRVDELLEKLNGYQQQALTMQKTLLYRLGVRSEEQDFVEAEIKALLKEFGAEEYSISKEFTEQVRRFIASIRNATARTWNGRWDARARNWRLCGDNWRQTICPLTLPTWFSWRARSSAATPVQQELQAYGSLRLPRRRLMD